VADSPLSYKLLERVPSPSPEYPNKLWAFGGGKGGIGKSFLCSNIGVCAAQLGHEVVIIDLDLGGANLHTCLGGTQPKSTLSDFLTGRIPHLEGVFTETPLKNLRFISGANDALNVTNLTLLQKDKLIKAIRGLTAKFILLDLGAGTSDATMDFFIAADQSVVVTTPEPTSIENAYRFVKTAFYKKVRQAENNLSIQHIIDEAMDAKNRHGIRTPSDLVKFITTAHPNAGKQLKECLDQMHLKLIINQARSYHDTELGSAMKSVCQKYFSMQMDYLGHVDFDNTAWQSLRKKQPLVTALPFSNLTSVLFRMARQLADPSAVAHQPLKMAR
jgi:flagellar biosynthesis protein FlhG